MTRPQSRHTSAPIAHDPPPPPAPLIARYDAVVSLQVERSALTVVDRAGAEANRPHLASGPGFGTGPPAGAPAASGWNRISIETVCVARMKATLDFGAELVGDTREQLAMAIDDRWSDLASARSARASGRATPNYERIAAEVLLREDGQVEWAYTRRDDGAVPLPVPGVLSNGRTVLDSYVQNLLRLELMKAL